MPTMGCHSVIDKPEWVNRVMPPTTTMAKTSEQHSNSHAAMLLRSSGVEAWASIGADIEGVISIASNFATLARSVLSAPVRGTREPIG